MSKLNEKQSKAVEVVNEAIADYRKTLQKYVSTTVDESDPIMVEGETSAGYCCQLMVNPSDVAKILLRYDYPIYEILGKESPSVMWDELADQFGLSIVSSFDL